MDRGFVVYVVSMVCSFCSHEYDGINHSYYVAWPKIEGTKIYGTYKNKKGVQNITSSSKP